MIQHSEISESHLKCIIKGQEIRFGGNKKLKIYGLLNCKSGKRMKRKNRVFFSTEMEAIKSGFRPCGYCMKTEYNNWKNRLI